RSQIVAGRWPGPQIAGSRGMSAPQQEPGQGEEHRDSQVEPAEQPTGHTAGVAGLKRDVGDDDADGRAGAHSLYRGQKAADPADLLGIAHRHSLPVRAHATIGYTHILL